MPSWHALRSTAYDSSRQLTTAHDSSRQLTTAYDSLRSLDNLRQLATHQESEREKIDSETDLFENVVNERIELLFDCLETNYLSYSILA